MKRFSRARDVVAVNVNSAIALLAKAIGYL